MAGEKSPKSAAASPRTPGGRTTPVLVPQGALAGQPDVPLDRPVTTVGSNENARLHLVSRTVSKGHAIFVNSGGTTYVADMASRTGVLVNGKLVRDSELKTGDRVQIGKFVFRYRSPANTAPAVAPAASPAAAVIVVGSPAVPAKGRTVIIGRRETSDIAIPGDAGVSAAHAVIFQMDGRWYMRDLGSRTGTKVNDSPVHQQELKFGDRIVIGSTNILFQPGAAKALDPEDSFVPEIPMDLSDELGIEELPAEELPAEQVTDDPLPAEQLPVDEMSDFAADALTEPEPVMAFEPTPVETVEADDAIPLGDWRAGIAAQPMENETENELPLELEPEPVPVEAGAPSVEVAGKADEQPESSATLQADDDVFALADETPVAPATVEEIEVEPIAVEPAAAEPIFAQPDGEFDFADEAAPVAAEPPVEATALEAPADAESAETEIGFIPEPVTEPVLAETVVEAPVEVSEPIVEAVPVTFDEPEIEVAAEPEAVAKAEEPAPTPEPALVSEPAEIVAISDEPVASPEPVQESISAAESAEPVSQAARPTPTPTPTPPPPTIPAPAAAKAPPLPPVEHLLSDVEEFVFVPEERVDPNAVPEVIFWGDPDLDSAAEHVVTSTAPVVPQDQQPPLEGDGDSSGDDGPPGPPSDPPPVAPPDSSNAVTGSMDNEPEGSAPAVHTEYSAVSEIVPQHHGEPAVAVHELPALDVTEIAPTPLPPTTPVEVVAAHDTVDAAEVHMSVAGEGTADLSALVNVDLVQAHESLAEPPAGYADVAVEVPEIEAPERPSAPNFDAEHVEAEHVPAAVSPGDDLHAPVVDDRDEFFMPMTAGLEEAFKAARAWNDAPAEEDAEPFEVIAPFQPEAQGSWEAEASPVAVDLLEPHETAEPIDVRPDVEAFDVAMTEPGDDSVESVVSDLELPEVDAQTFAESTAAAADVAIEFPVLDSVTASTDQLTPMSAAVNADWIEPSVSVSDDAVLASAELDLPDISGGEIPSPTDRPGMVDLDLAAPVATWASTPGESVARTAAIDLSIADWRISDRAKIDSAELDLPTVEFSKPIGANFNVDLDVPVVASISVAESIGSTSPQQLDLPHIDEAAPRADAAGDFQVSMEAVEFTPSVSIADEPEFADVETPAAEQDEPELADFSDVEPEANAPSDIEVTADSTADEFEFAEPVVPVSSITETPPTTDFSAVVSAHDEPALDEVTLDEVTLDEPVLDEFGFDEPVEESIRMSEDGSPVTLDSAASAEAETADESDLEFLEFGDSDVQAAAEKPPVVEPAPVPVDTAPAPVEPEKPAVAAENPVATPGARKGPSLFGFEFEGGSFLGGMPISLGDKSAIPKPPVIAAPPPPVVSPTFDARATPPSGLGNMVPPVTAAAPPSSRAATPPRPVSRPAVPPPAARTAGSVTSLSGLVSDARSAAGTPVIPPMVKKISGNTVAAGVGLTGTTTSTAGLGSRNVEVFSQLSAPIGVEVFGGRPGNPDQFTVPDIKDTTEPEPAAEEPAVEAQPDPALEYASATESTRNIRWWRVPLWVSLMIITPAVAWMAVPHVVHEVSSFDGSLAFSGLKEQQQQPVDLHNFVETQKALLLGQRSEEIRQGAEAILLKDGHPAGFTADPAQFAQAVQTQDFVFADDHVEFKLDWPDPVMARAQVDAVLLALAEKDQDLVAAKKQAQVAADDAKAKLDAINAELAKLRTDYDAQAEKASEKPDGMSVHQNQQDVTTLTDQYNSAHATRVASESVLADLKAQDPTRPIDPDSDKEIVDLKKRLDLLTEQIRLAKSKGGVSVTSGTGVGTDVGVGATTQPDSDASALLKVMQEQADMWSGKIQRRRDELAALAAIPADQRAVNLASAIENLSVKITGLQKTENDLKARLDVATAQAAKFQKNIADANLAEVNKNQLYSQIQQKDAEKQQAADNAAKLETAYDNSITVAGQSPARFLSVTNYRRTAVLVISILAWLLFGRLTLGELLRPRVMTSRRPNAAPLANPPMRVIPWPEPHQLQGLKGDGA
jgi:pSer/pThr/pTyr-binding forkhead associated (FHA) protein